LPFEPCGGNLKLNKTFSGCMPEHCLVGQQDKGNGPIMIMNGGNSGAGETDEGALPGRRAGLLSRRSFLVGSAAGVGALGWPVA